MKYTGERIIPDRPECAPGTLLFETHISRYRFATAYVTGREVLDIACGVGYGTHHLAIGGATKVHGGDLSPDAIAYAQCNYAAPNASFGVMSADALPFPAASIDVVVSFETIEHIPSASAFVAEISRVLRPHGLVIISTPNRMTYGLGRETPDNEFHVQEFTGDEFARLLSRHFEDIRLFSQRSLVRVSTAAMRLDALVRRLRGADRLGVRKLLPGRIRRTAARVSDAYATDCTVRPSLPADNPMFFVAVARRKG